MGQEKSLLYRNPYDSYTKQNSISGSSNYSCGDKSKKSSNHLNLHTTDKSQHKNQELNNHQNKQHHRHHHHHQQTFFDYGKYRNYQNLSTEQIPNLINNTTTINHKTNQQSKTTKLLSENLNNSKLNNNTSLLRSQSSTSATVYSTSCYCSSISINSTSTQKSSNNKQKDYLNHHLYIKSYLDILEEDVKAKRNFKKARPGIRNYTPKILTIDDNKKNLKKESELWI